MVIQTACRGALIAALAAAFVFPSGPADAQNLPERFLGIWKHVEGEPSACSESDWDSDKHNDQHIRVAPREVDYHEARCRIASVQTARPDDDDRGIRVTKNCAGEGEKWQSSEIWQIRKVIGATMLLAAITARGNESIYVYRKCDPAPGGASGGSNADRSAQEARKPLPDLVQRSIDGLLADKCPSGEHPKPEPGFMTEQDINADGKPDYILDYGRISCKEPASGFFCGTAGCSTQVFASRADGAYVEVLNENVRGLSFASVKGRPAMVLSLHGNACGRSGHEECRVTLFWNGKTFRK